MKRNSAVVTFLVAGVLLGASLVDCVGDEPESGSSAQADATSDQFVTDSGPVNLSDAALDAGPNPAVQVSAGWEHSCAVLKDGSLWCWGRNAAATLQSPPDNEPHGAAIQVIGVANVVSVSAGWDKTCVVEKDNSVWCWGLNLDGSLGHDTASSGDVVCGMSYCNATPAKVVGVSAVQVAAGEFETCAVTTTGSVVCWGWNGNAIVKGPPTNEDISTPTAIAGLPSNIQRVALSMYPGGTACAIDSSSNVWCWGYNEHSELGHAGLTTGDIQACGGPPAGGTDVCNPVPREVLTAPDAGAFSNVGSIAPSFSTCASQLGGSVSCWGANPAGQFGNGTVGGIQTTPALVNNLSGVASVVGTEAKCALKTNGEVWCWSNGETEATGAYGIDAGCHNYGEGAVPCLLTPTKVAGIDAQSISLGTGIVAAITKLGQVVAWGDNGSGALGHPVGESGDDSKNHNPTPMPVQGLP